MSETPSDEALLEKYNELAENERDALNELLWRAKPFDWPGRAVVELDNLGDPSAWLEDQFGEPPATVLLGEIADFSGSLAEEYASEIKSQGYPLPSDFNDGADDLDDLASIQADFRGFLAAWRERAMPIILQRLGG